jgi:hypothetical protein
VQKWYAPSAHVLNETEIFSNHGEVCRPDRVVFSGGEVTVVDYKTGERTLPVHEDQVSRYMELIRRMGYGQVRGFLWYIDRNLIREVTKGCSAALLFVLSFLLSACNATKHVGEGEYLLNRITIESDNPAFSPSDLRPYIRQQPNSELLGLFRWQLYVYNLSGKEGKGWFGRKLRAIGEAPAILDTVLVAQSATELRRFLTNRGYLHAEVSAGLDTAHRKAGVTYRIRSGELYRIGRYVSRLPDAHIDSIVHAAPPAKRLFPFRSPAEEYVPLIRSGNAFDLDMLSGERQRIATLLRQRGYYAFNREHLSFLADTASASYTVGLSAALSPVRRIAEDGTVHEQPHRPYFIRKVELFTDYDALAASDSGRFTASDSAVMPSLTIRYGQGGRSLRPSVLSQASYMLPGQLYNERNVEQTYAALSAFRSLKNISIRFTELEENDSLKLDCSIFTSPEKTQGVGFDVEGTNSAGDFGVASAVSYRHRNLFHGAEEFSGRIRGAYESLLHGSSGIKSYWEFNGEAGVFFPRFVFPFLSDAIRRSLRASTELRLSYNRQSRPEYARSIVSATWDYLWQGGVNASPRHRFRLFDMDYVFLPRIDGAFRDSLPKSMQLYNYANLFIMSSAYTYSFATQPSGTLRDSRSLRASFELAGNVPYLVSTLAGAARDDEGHYELFGIDYSQFAKADCDVSAAFVLDGRNSLALHAGAGVVVPYGNSVMVPFERRYFAGGANGVRGWSVRELGPGSMPVGHIPVNTRFALQVGDVRLDLNVEYRSLLLGRLQLAAYLDAGNIWTIRAYPDQPGGNFSFSRFYKEIAASYGLGLRADFSYLLLRLDTGFKAYDPQRLPADRWALLHPNFSNNFALHLAVGYPF